MLERSRTRSEGRVNVWPQRDPVSFFCVVIDAADKCCTMAASKFNERPFVADLFEIEWPTNFRLLALCRPERSNSWSYRTASPRLHLPDLVSQRHSRLRTRFPAASESHGAQLHVLSSGNPRVQAMAMEGAQNAGEAIAALQIATNQPGKPLTPYSRSRFRRLLRKGTCSRTSKRLCQALATMHPAIPLRDLAKITDVSEDAIRSFAVALGRGLYFTNNSLQFRDEPTETWFTKNHSLGATAMRAFATQVAPHAADSAYIATVLPQLLFEARMVDELVRLALSDEGLPADVDDLQAAEIARGSRLGSHWEPRYARGEMATRRSWQ